MMDRLNLCDFGIRPGMDDDASPAFAVVLAACREQRVSHLRIEPGIYHIRNARAEALMQRVLNGELGRIILEPTGSTLNNQSCAGR